MNIQIPLYNLYKTDHIHQTIGVLVAVISYLLSFDYKHVAETAIDIMGIASAVYLAIYPLLQGSENLIKKLATQDSRLPKKTQMGVLNTYLKVGLIMGITSIVCGCVVLLTVPSSCNFIIPGGVSNSWYLGNRFFGFFHREDFLVAGQEPSLHVGVGTSLNLGKLLHALELCQHRRSVSFLLDGDEVFHDLVGQLAVALLALLLGDFALDNLEVGKVFAHTRQFDVGGAADGASFFQEALGDGDGVLDVVDFVSVLLSHGSQFLSGLCWVFLPLLFVQVRFLPSSCDYIVPNVVSNIRVLMISFFLECENLF